MFTAGTKVCVHASSIRGKKLGPKRYSLGYVSNSSMAFYVNYVKDFPIKRQNFIFVSTKIIFTRYGEEQRERSETRDFIQIIPVFLDTLSSSEVAIRTYKVIKFLETDELSKNKYWKEVSSNYVNSPSNIGIILPVGHIKARRMAGNELESWVNSVLRNPTFSFIVRNKLTALSESGIVNNDLLGWLCSAVRSSKSYKELMLWANSTSTNMKLLISSIQTLNTSFNKRMLEDNTSVSEVLGSSGQVIDLNSFAGWLVRGLLSNPKSIEEKEKILHKETLNSSMINVYKNLRPARDTYLNIKPTHV